MDSNAKKRDLIDELFIRYKQSYELTLETSDVIGPIAYSYILDKLTNNLKCDIKDLGNEMKYYKVFCKKERKHTVKLRKLNFEYLSNDEYTILTIKERFCYHIRKFRYERENKRFKKLIFKFMRRLPDEFFCLTDNEYENEIDTNRNEQEETSVNTPLSVSSIDETILEKNVGVEQIVDENMQFKDLEVDEEQLSIKLEDFFDNQ